VVPSIVWVQLSPFSFMRNHSLECRKSVSKLVSLYCQRESCIVVQVMCEYSCLPFVSGKITLENVAIWGIELSPFSVRGNHPWEWINLSAWRCVPFVLKVTHLIILSWTFTLIAPAIVWLELYSFSVRGHHSNKGWRRSVSRVVFLWDTREVTLESGTTKCMELSHQTKIKNLLIKIIQKQIYRYKKQCMLSCRVWIYWLI